MEKNGTDAVILALGNQKRLKSMFKKEVIKMEICDACKKVDSIAVWRFQVIGMRKFYWAYCPNCFEKFWEIKEKFENLKIEGEENGS